MPIFYESNKHNFIAPNKTGFKDSFLGYSIQNSRNRLFETRFKPLILNGTLGSDIWLDPEVNAFLRFDYRDIDLGTFPCL